MLRITCPWCGPREEIEFTYGGEAGVPRPADPFALSDEEWAGYLFMRRNTRGLESEQWCHAAGCRRWFVAARDTVTCEIRGTYRIGEAAPEQRRGE